MTAELVRHEPTNGVVHIAPAAAVSLVSWAQEADAAYEIAKRLVDTSFCPSSYRGKDIEAAAAILAGHEIGLTPLAALRSFDVIQGTAAPRALTLRAVAQANGCEFITVSETATKVEMKGRRRGGEWETVIWTMDRARQLNLVGKDNWKKQPQAMLVARATSELARRIAADAILGIPYSAEELDDDAPPPKAGTVRRAAPPREAVQDVERPALPDEPDAPTEAATEAPRAAAERVSPRRNRSVEDAVDVPLPPVAEEAAAAPVANPDGPTDAQMRKLHASFNDHGIKDRDLRLAYCFDVIGREITSSTELTRAEASQVIERLLEDAPVEGEVVEDYDQPPLPGE